MKRPLFEVLDFPADELEWWSLLFSIEDDMNDKKKREVLLAKPRMIDMTPEQQKEMMRRNFD